MNRLMLTLKLLIVIAMVANPIANAKIESKCHQSSQTVFTYYGTAIGHGDQFEAPPDAHDQVWNIVFAILMATDYTLIDLRITFEGPYDSVSQTYSVNFEADFWDGGDYELSPVPLEFFLGGM